MTIARHTLELVSIVASALDALGALYLACDLLGRSVRRPGIPIPEQLPICFAQVLYRETQPIPDILQGLPQVYYTVLDALKVLQ